MTVIEVKFYETMIRTMNEIVRQNNELIELLKEKKEKENE